MKKSEADKIAQKIANDWKLFWMSQTQNSKQDYDNYFRRSLAVDANMRVHLESLISAALLEASNATKESQSVECVHSWKLEANQYVCMKCNLLNSIAEYKGKEKATECAEFDEKLKASARDFAAYSCDNADPDNDPELIQIIYEKLKDLFTSCQKSKALKLPEKARIDSSVMDEESIIFARHQNYWIDQIKSLNDGK